jgi:hypothetical protein
MEQTSRVIYERVLDHPIIALTAGGHWLCHFTIQVHPQLAVATPENVRGLVPVPLHAQVASLSPSPSQSTYRWTVVQSQANILESGTSQVMR